MTKSKAHKDKIDWLISAYKTSEYKRMQKMEEKDITGWENIRIKNNRKHGA